ncbi:unnamed protein product [Paramecium sonneborni]|uniref:Protein kinase domain-containing protein n=1 Tax=Paramecium sonneborni TaxID=65129 RepID=A0A8S1LJG4_9CILI|nr:unnamed protein product [Paramecium sonneborni]
MQLIERGQDLLNIIEYKLAVWALANFFEVYDRMTNSQQIKNIILIYCYQNQKKLLFKETKILRKLDHENNVKFLGTCKNTIILEFIDGNTLTNQYKNQFNRKLQKKTLNKFIIKLQKQSNTQLKKYIYHRDLKAYNIMIIDQQVKLIDFGLTSEINFVLLLWDSSLYRTRDISQKSYNEKKANIWALGESQYIKLFLGKFHFQAKMIKRLCQLKFLNSFYPNLSAENFKISYQISQIKIILKENYETYFIFLINLFYFLFNKIIIKSINISLKQKCNLKNIMLKIYQIIIIYLNFETSNYIQIIWVSKLKNIQEKQINNPKKKHFHKFINQLLQKYLYKVLAHHLNLYKKKIEGLK